MREHHYSNKNKIEAIKLQANCAIFCQTIAYDTYSTVYFSTETFPEISSLCFKPSSFDFKLIIL